MKKIKLNEVTLVNDYDYFILAETAFSHEGDISYLKKQIVAASEGKADGIKFQILLDYKDAYAKNSRSIAQWCINQEEEWIQIFELAKAKGLEIVVLPIDMKSLKFCHNNLEYIDALEIHSICFNEVPYLREIRKIPKNILLGVGGRTSEDISFTINELNINDEKLNRKLFLMYGFQSFPTILRNLNLLKLKSLLEIYHLVIGYADHTSYNEYKIGFNIIKFALLYGAKIIEKHLVLKMGERRVDYETAIGSKEFIELRRELDDFITIQGNRNLNILNEAETKYKEREKQLIIKKDLKEGDILNFNNIGYKVSVEKSDFEQKDYDRIINKKVRMNIKKGEVLKTKHINL